VGFPRIARWADLTEAERDVENSLIRHITRPLLKGVDTVGA
jgi:hypothetical protein